MAGRDRHWASKRRDKETASLWLSLQTFCDFWLRICQLAILCEPEQRPHGLGKNRGRGGGRETAENRMQAVWSPASLLKPRVSQAVSFPARISLHLLNQLWHHYQHDLGLQWMKKILRALFPYKYLLYTNVYNIFSFNSLHSFNWVMSNGKN